MHSEVSSSPGGGGHVGQARHWQDSLVKEVEGKFRIVTENPEVTTALVTGALQASAGVGAVLRTSEDQISSPPSPPETLTEFGDCGSVEAKAHGRRSSMHSTAQVGRKNRRSKKDTKSCDATDPERSKSVAAKSKGKKNKKKKDKKSQQQGPTKDSGAPQQQLLLGPPETLKFASALAPLAAKAPLVALMKESDMIPCDVAVPVSPKKHFLKRYLDQASTSEDDQVLIHAR